VIHTFLENIQESIDKKTNPIGIFLGLTKAYDVINHEMLLAKLSSYGGRGIANSWFESYLLHRKLVVELNHSDSKSLKWETYFSPKRNKTWCTSRFSSWANLFLYINDLPINIEGARVVLFTDDINMLVTAEDGKILQHKINKAVEELHSWFYTNNLRTNVEKTIAISVQTRQKRARWILHINQKQNS
jgi:hypothetical protein